VREEPGQVTPDRWIRQRTAPGRVGRNRPTGDEPVQAIWPAPRPRTGGTLAERLKKGPYMRGACRLLLRLIIVGVRANRPVEQAAGGDGQQRAPSRDLALFLERPSALPDLARANADGRRDV
jgi:hypothetical protein